jgi:hypothetical protein
MRAGAVVLLLAALAAGGAAARAPETSIRPQPRPMGAVATVAPGSVIERAEAALVALERVAITEAARAAVVPVVPVALPNPELPELARRPPPARPQGIAPRIPRDLSASQALAAALADPARAPAAVPSADPDLPATARQSPPPRPQATAPRPAAPLPAGPLASSPRPEPRPARLTRPRNPAADVPVVQVVAGAASAQAVARSLCPPPQPDNLRRRAVVRASGMVQVPDPQGPRGRAGSVCGDPAIRGEPLSRITSRVQGCGIDSPVRVTEVDGVRLSTAITVDCGTAQALRRWVSDTVQPQVGRLGGGVESLQIFAHYACRPRNNQRGARVSEHGRGRAVDIGAINLANGSSLPVLGNWNGQHANLMRSLHRGACGPFGTVLGPAADRFHANHFHFDTARHRSGAYCR